MLPLELIIRQGNWRSFSRRNRDSSFAATREKVFQRDHYSCQFCGFQAHQYQEVVNIDGNYRNSRLDNLATSCPFCTQCFFLEAIGSGGFGGGRLVYIPDMAQPELNSFCHVIFCAMTNATDYRDSAQALYRNLKACAKPIEEQFGKDASKPGLFCQMLIEQEDDVTKLSQNMLKDIRLLPLYPSFKKELETWANAAAQELEE
ncbi:MAG: HNH endonuclease [Gammaproteobacteria bacterium]|nr:HNH endonuclease [Gammaproteobacteria bacterium]